MMLLWLWILVSCVQSRTGTIYKCNSNLQCGCSINSTTINRIVNGETAEIGAWGWAVSLRLESFLCGGSILSSSWIITAAHCVEDIAASEITVYAGSNMQWSGSQIRNVSRIVAHPDYSQSTLSNDIALLKLTSPLNMESSGIRTVCLPSVNATFLLNGEWPAANTTVVAIGWGRLSENGSISSTLQQVTLDTIDYRASTCTPLLHDSQLQLCAGVPDGSKDTCQGDSGGPLLMFSAKSQWILIGLTSYGEGCGQPGYSGVYTRVATYQAWIRSTISTACIQTPSIYPIPSIIFIILKAIK